MQKIAITGYTGFIGSHLMNRLLKDGHTVYPIARNNYRNVKCDRVYHLACPSSTIDIEQRTINVMDTILDETRKALQICPSALFVNASSKGAIDINDTPQGAYNVSKRCMETYLKYSGIDYVNYRIPSVYGPGMNRMSYIQRCIDKNAYMPDEPNKMHYIAHIDDVVDALVNLTEIKTEEITLGNIYEQFNSGWRGIHRTTSGTCFT